jgi:diguanylate cyclase (GGDEF)-like protein
MPRPPATTTAAAELDEARGRHHEDPAGALDAARRWAAAARASGDGAILARALALEGIVTVNQGRLRAAFGLAAEAEALAEATADPAATVEVAGLNAQLSFFSGSYREALRHAERCIAVADGSDEFGLRIYARRCCCMVLGNLDVPEWPERLDELLAMSVQSGSAWEEAISRNDVAHLHLVRSELSQALAAIDRALAVAEGLAPHNRFLLGVLCCTRAEILVGAGRSVEGLASAQASIAHLTAMGDPNPYLYGMAVGVEVQALLDAGRVDEACRSGRRAVQRLGDAVPQARSMILQEVATALRESGRSDEAYDALAESAVLERAALRELTELQRDLERAVIGQGTARREADTLATKNLELETTVAELADAHRELEHRAQQLEALRDQLREQADRDWLTGLYNRRYLAAALEEVGATPGLLSLAAIDLDHFKGVNDRFGHDAGDRVLIRAAELLARTVRDSDVVARSGGEEFVVLMPLTSPEEARACAERLRAVIAAEPWDEIAPGMQITASIGVVSDTATADVGALARLADRRLYAAKNAGRNRVDAESYAV